MKLPVAAAALFASLACLHCLAPSDDPSLGTQTEALTTGDSTGTTTTTSGSTVDGTKKDGGSTNGTYYDIKLVDLIVAH